ncbi:MAG: hypothetical protein EOM37_05375 [Proteobacteria bacterium]|nr:hypothetical protein [Pseudomonadota bacterium]
MNRWEEQYKQHPIHNALSEMKRLIDARSQEADASTQIEKRRFLKVLETYQDALSQLDPELVPTSILDGLNANIQNQGIQNSVNNFNATGALTELHNANNQISGNLTQLCQLLAITKKTAQLKPSRGAEKAADEFIKAIESKTNALVDELSKISNQVREQQTKLNELSGLIDTKRQESENMIALWQEQFSNSQHQRDTDFVADQKVRTDTYADWRKQIENETSGKVEAFISKTKDKLDQSQQAFDTSIADYLASARDKHQAILDLYELVAGDSVAAGYLKNANEERTQANIWRLVAVLFIVATAIWTGVSYFMVLPDGSQASLAWVKILKALSVTGVLLFGAIYSGNQSNSHRSNEKKTRWFALEVKAIDPFIASLETAQQQELKKSLSDRLFAQRTEVTEKAKPIIEEHAFSTVIKGIVDVLKAK